MSGRVLLFEMNAVRRRQVFVEYVMLRGVNDGEVEAHQLGALLQGRDMVLNLIPWNPIYSPDIAFEARRRLSHPAPAAPTLCGRASSPSCARNAWQSYVPYPPRPIEYMRGVWLLSIHVGGQAASCCRHQTENVHGSGW